MADEGMRAGPLGAGVASIASGVAVEHPSSNRLRLVATTDLIGHSTGSFSRPASGVSWPADGWASGTELVGFAFTQFALPVTFTDPSAADFHPAPDLRSPRAVLPLLARSADAVVLLAPIEHPHEQILAVRDDAITWGWHGDLDRIPAGFGTTLGVFEAGTVTEALAAWRRELHVVERLRANPVVTHLSYWTDNGAAYWYRTESDRTIVESVEDKVAELRAADVPVRSVELDSWAYPHAIPRPIAEIGYPTEVPPTGAMTWAARTDAFPAPEPGEPSDPIAALHRRLDLPLVMHARHIAPTSPHVGSDWWVDEAAAQPADPQFFAGWFDDASRRGVRCIEQDWMLATWFGVRQVRAEPGRAAEWQRTLDRLAAASGVDLLWCMATPADMVLAASLERVVAVRTSDDYRFAADPAFLWVWFLVVNRLADTLGLTPFKDCFFSGPLGDDAIDGDAHAELEAALSALSNGPVGIGDRLGRTDRSVVMRTCDDDGRLRRLDRPIAAIDDALFGGPARGERLMWATTTATTAHGVWTYVLAIHVAAAHAPIRETFALGGRRLVHDWRAGSSSEMAAIEVELNHRGWALFVVSPPDGPPAAEVGDARKYVVVESSPIDR